MDKWTHIISQLLEALQLRYHLTWRSLGPDQLTETEPQSALTEGFHEPEAVKAAPVDSDLIGSAIPHGSTGYHAAIDGTPTALGVAYK